jgi:MoxR-like ATPase
MEDNNTNQSPDNQPEKRPAENPASQSIPPVPKPSAPSAPSAPAFGEQSSIDRYRSAHDSDVMAIGMAMAKIKNEVGKVVIGMDDLTEMLMVALFSGGNVLLEGVPGIAKTLSARMLSKSINTEFSRIQFTPDLMPTDILGTTIFNMKTSEFEFKKGPIFSNIILIDEINRAPAKTQAALMEVMEEKQVTVEGESHKMGFPFFIIATQNPVEQEGTYKLPEAQMDRFLFRLTLDYPDLNDERLILHRFKSDFNSSVQNSVTPVIDATEIAKCMKVVEGIHVNDGLLDYIANIVVATRNNGDLYLGASPRASLAILKAAKALAVIRGKSFVTPDHVKAVTYPVLNHRIILSHERELEGGSVRDVINSIVESIEIPR